MLAAARRLQDQLPDATIEPLRVPPRREEAHLCAAAQPIADPHSSIAGFGCLAPDQPTGLVSEAPVPVRGPVDQLVMTLQKVLEPVGDDVRAGRESSRNLLIQHGRFSP
jgi:hypothetical protein